MEEKKRFAINMVATIVAFIVNLGINFILSPYIIENVGVDAYGFVTLANNFVNYTSLITIALNSMAGRFITIEIHKNNEKEANKYFNSVLVANLIISAVLIVPTIIMVFFLDKIINIPENIVLDTKVLFGLVFFNFAFGIINTTYSIATFVRNRLDLSSRRNIESYVIKAVILIVLFTFFSPRIAYVGIASCAVSLFLIICNIRYTKKLLPEIKVNIKDFEVSKILTIMKSGVWNTVTKLGQILSDGLDLLICNIWIDSEAMGQLSVAKTISGVISNLLASVSSIFQPNLTICYAKNQIQELIRELKMSMKVTGLFANIPLTYLLVFGSVFYTAWVPNQNIQLIQILTILTVQGEVISGVITPMYSIYTVTNNVRADAIIRVVTGFINVLIVFLLIKFTSLGIYAVAAVSIITGTLVNVTFVPIYIAKKCLKVKWNTFYPITIRYVATSVGLIIILLGIKMLVDKLGLTYSWITVIETAGVTGIIGLIINYIFLFSKEEKGQLIGAIKGFISKKKGVKNS
ncbi:MAG: hypothetical protein IKD76_05645 [Clostridia bacterium]|nr:hypothetical protein [Clostridia bacterium]